MRVIFRTLSVAGLVALALLVMSGMYVVLDILPLLGFLALAIVYAVLSPRREQSPAPSDGPAVADERP